MRIFLFAVVFLGGLISFAQTKQKIQYKVEMNGSKGSSSSSASNMATTQFDWVKKVTQQYSSNSWNLLEQYRMLPDKIVSNSGDGATSTDVKAVGVYHYLKGATKIEQLQSMGVNVHEVAHAYHRHNAVSYTVKNKLAVNWNNAEGFIYVSPCQTYYVSFPKERTFPSSDLEVVIPTSRRTLRYSTYITGNTSTQSHGVFGLLNEFQAYYLGAKYSFDMMKAYCEAEQTAAKGFVTWVQHSQSLMDAYYEFDFFIREYLLYMSKNHPKSYALLKAYKPFWQALNAIDKTYADLNDEYMATIRSQVSVINAKGKSKLSVEGNMLWLDAGSGKRVGVSLEMSAKQMLASRLAELRD